MHQDSFLFVLSAMINDFLIRLLWIRKLWDLTRQNNTRILRIYFCALLVHAPLKNTYPFDKKTACLTVGSVGTACLITNSPDSTVYTSTYIYKETIGRYLSTYIHNIPIGHFKIDYSKFLVYNFILYSLVY